MSGGAPNPDKCRAELRELAERRASLEREQARLPLDLATAAIRAQAAGLSITEVARLAGVSRVTVYAAMAALEKLDGEARAS